MDEGSASAASLPSKPRSITEHQNPLVAPYDEIYRGATGSAIYYSLDRREIQFAVKELARRMSKPLDVDWLALKQLGRYLLNPEMARVTLVTESDKASYRKGCLVYTSDAADE